MKERVKAVAMTNSVHARDLIEGEGKRAFMFDVSGINITCLAFFLNISVMPLDQNCVNWVVSTAKKGEVLQDLRYGCTSISSGKCYISSSFFFFLQFFFGYVEQEIADFTLNAMLEDIMRFIYIKMGDIEPAQEESEDEDDENRELTKEELADLEDIDILSVE